MKLINTRTYRKFRYCLSRKHELPSDKFIINPLLLVSLIPFLGALYLWSFFMQFKIDYMQLYFKVEDCVSTIYSNLIFFYFIIAIIILGSSFLFFDYSHNIKNNNLKKVQIYLIEFLLSSVIVIINHAIFQVFWSQFLLSLFFIFATILS